MESRALAPGEFDLLAELDLERPRVYELAGGRACLISHRAPLRNRPNEDAALVAAVGEDAALLAVADGAGGMPAGGAASRLVLEVLAGHLAGVSPDDLRAAVLDGLEAANREVLARKNGSATTIVVATIVGGRVRTYHAGDSVGLLAGQRGKLKHMTVAHSPTGYAYESGLFDELEAAEHPERHLVNNMLGIPDLRLELGPELPLAPRDTVLLSSDGLLDNLLLEDVLGIVTTGPVHVGTEELFTRCRDHMRDGFGAPAPHPDDLTLLLYRPTPQSARLSIVLD